MAWILQSKPEILTFENRSISKNRRISITHDGYNSWQLRITQVQLSDRGYYRCIVARAYPIIEQVNNNF